MLDLREIAADALQAALAAGGAGSAAEVYVSRGQERGIELREGRPDGIHCTETEGIGVRILREGRMGFASAGGLGLATVKASVAQAAAQLGFLETDPARVFAAPAVEPAGQGELAASLWDESLFAGPLESLEARLRAIEDEARAGDPRLASMLRVGYGESRGEVAVANSQGVSTYERGGSASVGASALFKESSESQIGSAFQSSRRQDALDFSRVARDCAARGAALLGARKLPSGRRSVIFDPWVAGELLELIASLLSADNVQRGKSLLAGKLGKAVGSPLLTFQDDPRLPGGNASALFDDEGSPTRSKTMIEGGVVREFFYDAYTASRDKRATNGSAERGSYRGLPSPGSSNFFLKPGKASRDSLIRDTKDGILVLDIMGMHTADPVSGEFSVGVSGLAVSGGELSHPIKGAMISGNLVDLLGRVDAVADDLTFYGSLAAPTFRVAHMTVA